jgi:hypothetical protein
VSFSLTLDLRKVVPQMAEIVSHPPFERGGLVVADDAGRLKLLRRHRFDHRSQMAIQGDPGGDQIGPRALPIPVQRHPSLLIVPEKLVPDTN